MKHFIFYLFSCLLVISGCNARPDKIKARKQIAINVPAAHVSHDEKVRVQLIQDDSAHFVLFQVVFPERLHIYAYNDTLGLADSFHYAPIARDPYNFKIYKNKIYISYSGRIHEISRDGKTNKYLAVENKPDSFYNYDFRYNAHNNLNDSVVYLFNFMRNKEDKKRQRYFLSAFRIKDSSLSFVKYVCPVFDDYKKKNYYNNGTYFDVNNDTFYYCIGYHDKIYACDINSKQLFTINIPDYISGYSDYPMDEDSAHDYQYLMSFFTTTPQISCLRYDIYRNLLHVLIKKEQPLTNKKGEVNNRFSSGFYWLVFDPKGKLLKKYELPANQYKAIMYFTKNYIFIKRNEKNEDKIILDAFTFH